MLLTFWKPPAGPLLVTYVLLPHKNNYIIFYSIYLPFLKNIFIIYICNPNNYDIVLPF